MAGGSSTHDSSHTQKLEAKKGGKEGMRSWDARVSGGMGSVGHDRRGRDLERGGRLTLRCHLEPIQIFGDELAYGCG